MLLAIKKIYIFQIEQKRKKLKKDGRLAEGIPEDDPDKFKHSVYVMTMKVDINLNINLGTHSIYLFIYIIQPSPPIVTLKLLCLISPSM